MVSSTPLSQSIAAIRKMEDCGASAVVLSSLFEEQLILESRALDNDLSRGTNSFAESLDFLPEFDDYRQGHETYLEQSAQGQGRRRPIPVLASLNGATPGGWIRSGFAKDLEHGRRGRSRELNTYSLAPPASSYSQRRSGKGSGRSLLKPESRKASPSPSPSSSLPSIPCRNSPTWLLSSIRSGQRSESSSSISRFYQPGLQTSENLDVVPSLHFSTSEELLLRLHWAAILFSHVKADIAITGGVHTAEDVLKSMMAGAQVSMVASSLHVQGIDHITTLINEVMRWMTNHEYESIRQMRGSLSRRSVPDTSAFERGNYIKTLSSYTLEKPTTLQ